MFIIYYLTRNTPVIKIPKYRNTEIDIVNISFNNPERAIAIEKANK